MAESTITVCDDCGEPAVTTILLRVAHGSGAREKDVCRRHEKAALENTRPSKRGRKKVVSGTAQRRRKSYRRKTTARKTTRRRRRPVEPQTEAA